MKLICASCGDRWTPTKGAKRTNSCPRCRRQHISAGSTRGWRTRRLAAPPVGDQEPAADLPETLEELMAAADAASAKALDAAMSITRKRQ